MWDGWTKATNKSTTYPGYTNHVWPVRGGILPPPPPFSGGSGTAADPYQVETAAQLDAVRNYLDSYFILTADLDLDVAPYNEGAGWQPIGTYVGWENAANVPFTGSVDGNGHSIAGLSLDRPTAQGVGLFGLTDGATIRDLSLSNLSVTGRTAGGLTGWAFNTTITGVQTAGTVTALTRAGGLAGEVRGSTISDSGSACTVSTTNGTNAGGLIGQMEATTVARSHATGNVSSGTQDIAGGLVAEAGTNSVISESFATGAVSGRDEIGGLVGYLGSGSRVETSYALGQVIGNSSVGGLIGDLDKSTIAKAYATGAVNGATRVGGLVGWLQDAASAVDASYATGKVSGTTDLGGLVGLSNGATVTVSYYNSETSGQSDTGKGEPRTTAQMRQGMAYNPAETYVGWFAGTPAWAIGENFNGGYPYLQALPRFTVAAAITGRGSIQWIGEYPHGATAELRLFPATDFGIKSAEGCGGTLAAPLFTTAPLTANCTVTGQFIEEFPWILFLPKKPADKK
jgi:hypothetical protein